MQDVDLFLSEPLPELLEQVDRPGDARRGQALDRAGGEAALELPGAQYYVEATPRERDAHAAVVFGVRRGLDQALGLESLNEGGGGRTGHPQLGGDVLAAGRGPSVPSDRHEHWLR